jgi:O-antigen/teichoic acid export membrane protein
LSTAIVNKTLHYFSYVKDHPLTSEFAFFAFSTLLLQASKMIVSFVGAKLLGPTVWGEWYLLNLILLYGPNIQLGTLNAMNRDVPIFRGRQEWVRVREIQENALGFQLLTGVLLTLVVWSAAFIVFPQKLRIPTFCIGFLLFFNMVYLWLQMYLKSMACFHFFSRQQIIFGFLLPLIAIPLTFRLSLTGFILGQALTTAVVSYLVWKMLRITLLPSLRWDIIWQLIKIGWPILTVGFVYTLIRTIDRWVIAGYLGSTQLGHFSLALLASNVLLLLPMVVAQQIYPRMAECWGRTRKIDAVFKWVKVQIAVSVLLSCTAAFIVGVSMKLLVPILLPEYLPGLPAVYPMLLIPILLSLASGFANLMNTIDKQVYCLAVQLVTLPIMIILDIVFVNLGFGIIGVSWATVFAFAGYSLGIYIVSRCAMIKFL